MKSLVISITVLILFIFTARALDAETIDSIHLPWIQDRAAVHEVPLEIVIAVAIVESNITMINSVPNSNGSQDIGVMQLNSRYIQYHKETFWYKDRDFNPYNAEDNIEMGIIILRNLYVQTGDWDLAVQAYNVGCSGLKQNPDSGKYYLVKVIKVLNELKL